MVLYGGKNLLRAYIYAVYATNANAVPWVIILSLKSYRNKEKVASIGYTNIGYTKFTKKNDIVKSRLKLNKSFFISFPNLLVADNIKTIKHAIQYSQE